MNKSISDWLETSLFAENYKKLRALTSSYVGEHRDLFPWLSYVAIRNGNVQEAYAFCIAFCRLHAMAHAIDFENLTLTKAVNEAFSVPS